MSDDEWALMCRDPVRYGQEVDGDKVSRVIVRPMEGRDTPTWVVRKFEKLAREEGISYYDFVAKYDPSYDPTDWDNDPGSPEQAYA